MPDAVTLSCVRPESAKHRATDWRLHDDPSRIVCGLCHPCPFPDELVKRRSESTAEAKLDKGDGEHET